MIGELLRTNIVAAICGIQALFFLICASNFYFKAQRRETLKLVDLLFLLFIVPYTLFHMVISITGLIYILNRYGLI